MIHHPAVSRLWSTEVAHFPDTQQHPQRHAMQIVGRFACLKSYEMPAAITLVRDLIHGGL